VTDDCVESQICNREREREREREKKGVRESMRACEKGVRERMRVKM